MEEKTISNEDLLKVKSLDRIDFHAFKELVKSGAVTAFCKFKVPRTIFFDEETGYFLYVNPYHKALCKCGEFTNEEV
jgi:hypothetical protein